ncbi:alpha/beta hydrolase [Streptomyces sp. J2-1]|uniref:alpha/beta fold hydrolase n=1 Tax=Streptomyces corallincola TaxID=2851888 RepID=UPI001C380FFB|nr:alpha/beta hydrolase [Streptomyces corallincola]MBV2353332.1 alpha/beta hydrolase [Streptomyces corallincola]
MSTDHTPAHGADTTSGPLAPGTHDIEIDGGPLRYHVAGSGPVCLVHPGGPGFTWDYLRMPAVEEHLTLVYVEPLGTGASGRSAAHPHGYTRDVYVRALDALTGHLGAGRVHLLGHSHGAFVAQYHALKHADRLAGVVLYESAPAVGPEHFAEAARNLEEFARAHAGHPGLADVLAAWRSVPEIADDEAFTTAARRLFPAYLADYWGREREFAPVRDAVSGTYISGLDADLAPAPIDDRDALASLDLPTLVIVGRHDFICGPRWAREIHERVPGSRLVVLEDSGHFGHLEQPAEFAEAVVGFVTATTRP